MIETCTEPHSVDQRAGHGVSSVDVFFFFFSLEDDATAFRNMFLKGSARQKQVMRLFFTLLKCLS